MELPPANPRGQTHGGHLIIFIHPSPRKWLSYYSYGTTPDITDMPATLAVEARRVAQGPGLSWWVWFCIWKHTPVSWPMPPLPCLDGYRFDH